MLDWIMELLTKFADTLTGVLPISPFAKYITQFSDLPFLGYLNWFVPVGSIVKVGIAWLGCIALFYVYSIIMRWIKMIGD